VIEEELELNPEVDVYVADPEDLEVVPVPSDPAIDAYLQSPVPVSFPVESAFSGYDVTGCKRIVRQRIKEKVDLSR